LVLAQDAAKTFKNKQILGEETKAGQGRRRVHADENAMCKNEYV